MPTTPTYYNTPTLRFPEFKNEGDWVEDTVENLFTFIPNNTLSRAELNYENGDYLNVHYGDVLIKFGECLDVKKDKLPHISENNLALKFSGSILKNGDIVIADTAEDETVGKCTEIVNITNEFVVPGLHTIAIHPQRQFASRYLGFYMNSNSYRSQLFKLMQGVKVSSISKSALKTTTIRFPSSIDEQNKIAELLSSFDELLSATSSKLDQLKAYKKGLMQKLFPAKGKKLPELRFKEFEKDGEWKEKKLEELIEEVKETITDTTTIPLYSLTIEDGITSKTERYERGFLVTKKDNAFKVVSPNDFVSNPMNLRFGAVGFNHNSFMVCVSGYYDVFRFKETGVTVFWSHYLKSDLLLHKYDEIAIGSLIEKRRVYFSNLLNLKLLVPSIPEQRKIANCLTTIDEMISQYTNKVALLEQHKKGLMQQMFPQKNR